MNGWHIHIEGQVQGVGFRPFVYRTALDFGLQGWVNNSMDGVHIRFNAPADVARRFYRHIIDHAPRLSQILSHRLSNLPTESYSSFEIMESTAGGPPRLLLTPDFAICPACRKELLDASDRRHTYPFITCTDCGPRYSIIRSLPYDRTNTTMAPFAMCPDCNQEYNNPWDRRYYSQTNSCTACRISLKLFDHTGTVIDVNDQSEILKRVVRAWKEGRIVAIKGIGGYLLTCDALDGEVVARLRQRKHRPSKPLALMFTDLAQMDSYMELHPEEEAALQSPVAPIILATRKKRATLPCDQIAPGLDQLGGMLPYTPLYELLLSLFGRPVIATSGNISGSPIVFEDDAAPATLGKVADLFLSNDRDIVIPQDDSVVKFTPVHRRKLILRRSRGLAPTLVQSGLELPDISVVACGALIKSVFCLLHQGNTYVSQYLGDLDHFDTQQHYQKTLDHLMNVFHARPKIVLTDLHPDYASTRIGMELAQSNNIPFFQIQHHEAHFAAVLGENQLIHTQEPILGVIWDGLGIGRDGQIWGGEFFRYQNYAFTRCRHFAYFNAALGDKMAREPRLSALAITADIPELREQLQEKFTSTEWKIYQKLVNRSDSLSTSSAGRLFDGVASILGIMDKQTYEGEAAMHLESTAWQFFEEAGGWKAGLQLLDQESPWTIQPEKPVAIAVILNRIWACRQAGKTLAHCSALFHYLLTDMIKEVALQEQVSSLAFSGGVFQNSLLIDLIQERLGNDFHVYFHRQLSPSDENIAFGQLMWWWIVQQKPIE